ncbi:hypothetical protein [Marinobacter sp. VGCF2001]|uniref:hypothetical protein n=1 Tax=Marinobacter sp. VGCF2001 TaxID=3417189 RepID=UPI003CF257C2
MSYLDEYVSAVKFGNKLRNEKVPKEAYDDLLQHYRELADNPDLAQFTDHILPTIAEQFIKESPPDLAGLCHSVSQQFFDNWMQSELSQASGLAITVGSVEFKGTPLYPVSKSSLRRTLAEGFDPNRELDLHVWLTFPNMRVLDLTIVPTLLEKGLINADYFGEFQHLIWTESGNSELHYKPMLQDDQFLFKVDQVAGYA